MSNIVAVGTDGEQPEQAIIKMLRVVFGDSFHKPPLFHSYERQH